VKEPLRVGVLASGRGSNLQAILDASARADFPARVAVVVSDREGARALKIAAERGVPAVFLNPKDFGDREAYDAAIRSGSSAWPASCASWGRRSSARGGDGS